MTGEDKSDNQSFHYVERTYEMSEDWLERLKKPFRYSFVSSNDVEVRWTPSRWHTTPNEQARYRSQFVAMYLNNQFIGAVKLTLMSPSEEGAYPDDLVLAFDEISQTLYELANAAGLLCEEDEWLSPEETVIEISMLRMTREYSKNAIWSTPVNEFITRLCKRYEVRFLLAQAFPQEFKPKKDVVLSPKDRLRLNLRKSAMRRHYRQLLGLSEFPEACAKNMSGECNWMFRRLL